MKARNGFFLLFAMMMLAVLTLSLIMTTTLLALNCLSLATIYERRSACTTWRKVPSLKGGRWYSKIRPLIWKVNQ